MMTHAYKTSSKKQLPGGNRAGKGEKYMDSNNGTTQGKQAAATDMWRPEKPSDRDGMIAALRAYHRRICECRRLGRQHNCELAYLISQVAAHIDQMHECMDACYVAMLAARVTVGQLPTMEDGSWIDAVDIN